MRSTNQGKSNTWHFTHVALLAAALWSAGGCRTTGYDKGDAASRSLQQAAAEVQAESRAIDVTMEALNNLVNTPAADLKPQFKRFSSALARLEATARQTERTRERMEIKSAAYFEAWDKKMAGINYGIVRDQSESRRAEVTNQFHAVNTRYLDAQGVVRPLISYFHDIRTALSVDLTAAGLESVKSIVGNAERNARKVQMALGKLSDELTSSGAGWSSVAVRGEAEVSPTVSNRYPASGGAIKTE